MQIVQRTRSEYKKLPYINYSACKDFEDSRLKFYKKYILKEPEDEEKSATLYGDVVHCLLLTPEEFDDRFCPLRVGITPKPQMKELVDSLWKIVATGGELVRDPDQGLVREAFDQVAFDRNGERVSFKGKSFEEVYDRFRNEGLPYYQEKVDNYGKEVIDLRTFDFANMTVNELKTNSVTAHIVNRRSDKDTIVLREQIIEFRYQGHDMKAMCDIIIVDLKEKKIYIYDLKTVGWNFEVNVIKHRYYLQWSIYYQAVKAWAAEHYPGLEVMPMQFIVASQNVMEGPLIYTTSMKDLEIGLKGFTRNGREYKGVNQILDEIAWHSSYGIWNMSYTDFQNKGVRKVSLFQEI